jgi:hypothetical protein
MRVCQSLTIFGFSGSVDNARFSVAGDVRAINLNEWNADLDRRAPIVAAMVFVIDSLGYVVQSVAKLNYDSLARDVAGFRNGQRTDNFSPQHVLAWPVRGSFAYLYVHVLWPGKSLFCQSKNYSDSFTTTFIGT